MGKTRVTPGLSRILKVSPQADLGQLQPPERFPPPETCSPHSR